MKWYDVDLPDVINLRKTILPEKGNSFYISGSIFDFDWMKKVNFLLSDGILFISVGVLEYFNQKVVSKFLSDLSDFFPGGEIIFNTRTNNKVSSYFTKRTMKKMDIIESPAIFGNNFIKNFTTNSERIEMVEKFKLFSKTDLKSFWNKRTIRRLKYFELFSPSYIVHLKFKENSNPKTDST